MKASTVISLLATIASFTRVAGLPMEHELVEKDVVVVVETVTVRVTKVAGAPQETGQVAVNDDAPVEWSSHWSGYGGDYGKGWGSGKGVKHDDDQQAEQPAASVPATVEESQPSALAQAPPDTTPQTEASTTQAEQAPERTSEAAQSEPSAETAPPESQAPTSPAPAGDDQAKILAAHNDYRSKCPGAKQMRWDDELAGAANEWAKTCIGGHPSDRSINGRGYGQNVASIWSADPKLTYDVKSMFGGWVDEFKDYAGKGKPKAEGKVIGHYTQVVWKDSDALGCSVVKCANENKYNLVCNYATPGNYPDQYVDQVDYCGLP